MDQFDPDRNDLIARIHRWVVKLTMDEHMTHYRITYPMSNEVFKEGIMIYFETLHGSGSKTLKELMKSTLVKHARDHKDTHYIKFRDPRPTTTTRLAVSYPLQMLNTIIDELVSTIGIDEWDIVEGNLYT